MSYPKYLIEQAIGRKLLPNEQVHHKDGNPLNNELENLEIKLLGNHQSEHNQKYKKYYIFVKIFPKKLKNDSLEVNQNLALDLEVKAHPEPSVNSRHTSRLLHHIGDGVFQHEQLCLRPHSGRHQQYQRGQQTGRYGQCLQSRHPRGDRGQHFLQRPPVFRRQVLQGALRLAEDESRGQPGGAAGGFRDVQLCGVHADFA